MVGVWRCVETETPVILLCTGPVESSRSCRSLNRKRALPLPYNRTAPGASQTVFWIFCLIGTCICRYTSGVFHLVKQTGFSAKQLQSTETETPLLDCTCGLGTRVRVSTWFNWAHGCLFFLRTPRLGLQSPVYPRRETCTIASVSKSVELRNDARSAVLFVFPRSFHVSEVVSDTLVWDCPNHFVGELKLRQRDVSCSTWTVGTCYCMLTGSERHVVFTP